MIQDERDDVTTKTAHRVFYFYPRKDCTHQYKPSPSLGPKRKKCNPDNMVKIPNIQ